jgi:hypothetical protein
VVEGSGPTVLSRGVSVGAVVGVGSVAVSGAPVVPGSDVVPGVGPVVVASGEVVSGDVVPGAAGVLVGAGASGTVCVVVDGESAAGVAGFTFR